MNSIKLKNPITVNGRRIAELTYDTNAITAIGFIEAESKRKTAAGRAVNITPAVEFDFGLHLYLGFAAIIAVNPEIDWSDLERLHGADVVEVTDIGRNFILRSGEESPENESAEPSETTPGSTTPASQNLKKSG